MSKESRKNSKPDRNVPNKAQAPAAGQPTKRYLTDEEKAWIIRERLARRPVIIWRYSNGRWNKRLIFMLALMLVALVAALVMVTRLY